ncbi:Vacuolar H-ATPase V1 sector, subunit C [Phaffia rhodozyma]|uniref:Vacuolar H-ATPase V1 sector, subunit C n=1 Tax=Phaffia rhodozyma TaxID=264483 RepID=A0A0F7SUN0_PHARH|nr:Vacuolar H-ATPase V1 sector, subunit C [Phaffia rhodozyma]
MPSELAYWIVSSPTIDDDPSRTLSDIKPALDGVLTDPSKYGSVEVPRLKAGTLSSLLSLSDSLPKQDAFFTQTVSKLLDTLRSLLNDDKAKVELHTRVNDRPLEEYIFPPDKSGWKWDNGRWGAHGKVAEVIENLSKEMNSIDSIQKARLQAYNLAKGNLTAMQRRLTGNLSTKSLGEVVSKDDFVTGDSEFLDTLMVAVPNNLTKDWLSKYERLCSMIVPRSSSKIASDDEFTLYSVTVFKKVKDEFSQKCRENRFILRDFTYDEGAIQKQKQDLEYALIEERELWADLVRLSRTNFSEAFKLLVHLKVVRLYVESVLRYGLPAEYSAIAVKPEGKTSAKLLKTLSSQYAYLASNGDPSRRTKDEKSAPSGGSGKGGDEVGGEWAGVMEEEWLDFVLFEPFLQLISGSRVIKQGAEAKVYKTTLFPSPILTPSSSSCTTPQPTTTLIKHRFSKKYRHPHLDAQLTKARVISEARSLVRACRGGVNVPGVRGIDWETGVVALEFIEGWSVREVLGAGAEDEDEDEGEEENEEENEDENEDENQITKEANPWDGLDLSFIPSLIGHQLALLHAAEIIHGDLTTSNMMLRPVHKEPTGSRAPYEVVMIDFGLAFISNLAEDKAVDLYVLERAFSSTHPGSEGLFESILEAYRLTAGKSWKEVGKRLEDVRLRGRKRSMLG